MKLLLMTHEFAGKMMLRPQWGKEGIFFEGTQPERESLLAVELAGLKSHTYDAMRDWLIAHHKKAGRRGEHTDLVEPLWRRAQLTDLLDAHNPHEVVWSLASFFTLQEIADFAEAHGPALHAEIRAALAADGKKRAAALRKVEKRAGRIIPAISAAQMRIVREAAELELASDRAAIAALPAFDASAWIDVAARLKHDQTKRELLEKIGKELTARTGDITATLDALVARRLDRVHAPEMWVAIAPYVDLEQNVHGEAIDLTKAREVTVPLSWDTWKAGRVGRIKFNRAALMVIDGTRSIFVRGERKLLHSIRARRGSITRWGCTLVVGGRRGPASAHAKLLEVDRIDTLAQVDPRSAARLAGEDLAATDPITIALGHAHDDPKWRRILADLLVERIVGIDADVARRLARAEARANRR